MKHLDRVLQRLRIAKTPPFIVPGARVLHVARSDGTPPPLTPALSPSAGERAGVRGKTVAVSGCAHA